MRSFRSVAALVLCLCPLSSCSQEEPSGAAAPDATGARPERARAERASDDSSEPSTAPAAALPIDPAGSGRIAGLVLYAGEAPPRKRLAMGTDAACTAHATPPETETLVVSDGRVRDVFVYVKRGHEGWIVPPAPSEPVVLSQLGCLYTPHALALQTGQELRVHNGDATTHNVNMKAKRNGKSGNYTQGQKQADLSFTFERREHSIPFRCDIHPWMSAWVYVQDHPWFALSGADGSFAIEGLPAGSYTLEALHEELGELRAEVTVTPGAAAEVRFTYPG